MKQTSVTARGGTARPRASSKVIGLLMAFAALTFALASLIHFGTPLPLGFTTVRVPFPGAAVPESIIAFVVGAGALNMWTSRWAPRAIAAGTTLFALIGTVYGLSVTLRSTRTGDVVYHLGVLAVLLVVLGLLRGGVTATPRHTARPKSSHPN
jgi:hypothetical protein